MGTRGAGKEKEGWGKGEEGGNPGWGKEIGGGDRNDKRRVWGTAVQRSAKTSEGRWGMSGEWALLYYSLQLSTLWSTF